MPAPLPIPLDVLAVSPARAAVLCELSRAHIYNLIKRGELHAIKIGRSTRIPVSELQRLLAEGVVA